MKVIDRIALVLVIIGGLNWGSIGIFGLDIVAALFWRLRQRSEPAGVYPGLPVCHLVHHSLFPRGSRGADSARECVKSNPTP